MRSTKAQRPAALAAAAGPQSASPGHELNVFVNGSRVPTPGTTSPSSPPDAKAMAVIDQRLSRLEEAIALLIQGEGSAPTLATDHAARRMPGLSRTTVANDTRFSRAEFEARCRVQAVESAREIRELGADLRKYYEGVH